MLSEHEWLELIGVKRPHATHALSNLQQTMDHPLCHAAVKIASHRGNVIVAWLPMRFPCLIVACLIGVFCTVLRTVADEARPKPGTIVVTYASDAKLCESFVDEGSSFARSEGETHLEPFSESGGSFRLAHGARQLNDIAMPGSAVYTIDFDNDGKEERVLWTTSYTHYFDGDYFVILPNGSEVDVKRNYDEQGDKDVNAFVAWARGTGLSIYAGDMTPYLAERYTRFVPIIIGGTTLLWTFPQNRKWRPTALLYKPHPNGVLERICEYQRVEK